MVTDTSVKERIGSKQKNFMRSDEFQRHSPSSNVTEPSEDMRYETYLLSRGCPPSFRTVPAPRNHCSRSQSDQRDKTRCDGSHWPAHQCREGDYILHCQKKKKKVT